MWVDFKVEEQSVVLKSRKAVGVSWSLDSGFCGSPILRECSGTRGRGTTLPLFRAKRGLVGSPDTGATVVLDYAVL